MSTSLFLKKTAALHKQWRKVGWCWPRIAFLSFSDRIPAGLFCCGEILSPRKDPYQAASRLFQAVRKLDKMGPSAIVAFSFPREGIGAAVNDRLLKASGGKSGWNTFLHTVNHTIKDQIK